MILVLTEPRDAHADRFIACLRAKKASFIRFDPADFPTQTTISVGYRPGGQSHSVLSTPEGSVTLEDVTAVWYRRPSLPIVHDDSQNDLYRDTLAKECQSYVRDVWHTLECLYVPAPPFVIQRAQQKASQLKIAAALGFEIPPTLLTNDPTALIEFYREHHGQIISKPCEGIAFRRAGFYPYTKPFTPRDLGYANQSAPAR
jgi:hypothetical protein